jgi:hypothetical protein
MDWEIVGSLGSLLEGCFSCFNVIVLATVGISLFQMYRQRKQAIRQAALSASATIACVYQDAAQAMIQIDRFFAGHSDLRPHFYTNAPIEASDPNYEQVMSVAEMLVDHWDMVRVLQQVTPAELNRPWRNDGVYRLPWEGWTKYFIARYKNSRAIRRFWADNRELYSWELRGMLDPLPNEYVQAVESQMK